VTKSERTRAALLSAALELFEKRGFESTTAAQIAAAAGVSEMTFFRHFASKDAVLVADPYDPLIAEAVAAQPHGAGPLEAAANGVAVAWRAVPGPAADEVRERLRIVAQTPSLRGALARNSLATEDAIAEALRSRGSDPVDARIAAAAVVAALNASLLSWAADDDSDLGAAVLRAVRVVGGRIDA
jgi:AcrR family transcriptional regulator